MDFAQKVECVEFIQLADSRSAQILSPNTFELISARDSAQIKVTEPLRRYRSAFACPLPQIADSIGCAEDQGVNQKVSRSDGGSAGSDGGSGRI